MKRDERNGRVEERGRSRLLTPAEIVEVMEKTMDLDHIDEEIEELKDQIAEREDELKDPRLKADKDGLVNEIFVLRRRLKEAVRLRASLENSGYM